jgi:hypothetical protein
MTDRAQDLLREALTLPIYQRADFAAQLLASLDEPPTMGCLGCASGVGEGNRETRWARHRGRVRGRTLGTCARTCCPTVS